MIEVSSQALYTALKKALHISKTVHLSARAASLSIEAFDDVLIFSTEIDRISGEYMFNVSISDVNELKRVLRPHKGNSTIEFDGTSVVTITTGTTKTVILGGGYDTGYYASEDVNNFKHNTAKIRGGDFNRALEVTIPIARGSILDHIEMDVSEMTLFFRASDFLVDVRVSAPREGLEYTEVYAANLPVSAMSKVTKAINKNEAVHVNQITNGAVFVNDGCAFVVHSSMNTRIPNVHLGFEGAYFPVMISPFLLSAVIKKYEQQVGTSSISTFNISGDEFGVYIDGKITISEWGICPSVCIPSEGFGAMLDRMSGGIATMYVAENKPVLIQRRTDGFVIEYTIKNVKCVERRE